MAREFAREFYDSKAWKDCRKAYKASKQGLCERCLANGIISPGEIVHHKIHVEPDTINNPNVILNWDNLELLCRKCHGLEHGAKRFVVDEWGRVETR